MVIGSHGLEYASEPIVVRVDLEYDPRVTDPQANSAIWTDLTENARIIADLVFKGETSEKPRYAWNPAPLRGDCDNADLVIIVSVGISPG